MQIGLEHHRAGRFSEAESFYQRVLELDPGNPDALHFLGVIAHQAGKSELAVELIGAALAIVPDRAEALSNRGLALQELDRHAEALDSFDKALLAKPEFAEALFNRGNALKALARPDEAMASYDRALAINPDYAEALFNRGNCLQEAGRRDEALADYDRVVSIRPDFAAALSHRGRLLKEQGRLDEALASYKSALSIAPDFVEALSNCGIVLQMLRRYEEALTCHDRVLSIEPDSAEALSNRGNAMHELGRYQEALASYDKALSIEPQNAEALYNRGLALHGLNRSGEALASYDLALSIKPGYADASINRGNVLKDQGRLEEALASYRRAFELDPDCSVAHSNAIFVLDLMDGRGVREQQEERKRWYDLHGRRHAGSIRPHDNPAVPGRKLRVGYVSADFRRHAASYAFGPVLRRHDSKEFEVVCYSGVSIEDDVTAGLKEASGAWRSTLGVSDEALAGQIRRDRIDILVDLSSHMAGSRLPVFARKPAPVQVTAWGYPNGTGLPTIDYLLSDAVVVPWEERSLFAEEVIDLPCFLAYEPPAYLPQVAPLPALSGRPFTFGCISRIEKITDGALRLWARILAAVPEARLLVKCQALEDMEHRRRFAGRLGAVGIGEARVRLLGQTSHAQLLQTFHEVDLVLDPFPHGGGIGTAEALWMGVPVVTKLGETFMSRIGASILTASNLPEWIGRGEEDYVRIAVQASHDPGALAQVRAQMRRRLEASIFGDPRSYTQAVEAAYRTMWHRWCEGRNSPN